MKLIDLIDRQPNRVAFGRGGGSATAPASPSQSFAARADIIAAMISDPQISQVNTAGYGAPGDGGGAQYVRSASEPGHPGKVQSADGTWWEYTPGAEGINVRAFGATEGADCTGAFKDAQAVQIALASSFMYAGAWINGMPPIVLPAGDYQVSLAAGHLLEYSAGGAKLGVEIVGAGIDSTIIRITDGAARYLVYNDNDVQGTTISDLTVIDETGNGDNALYYGTSAGTFKHPVLSSITTRYLSGVRIEGTGNGDHLRATDVSMELIPAGGFGYRFDNPQSIGHVFIGCQLPQLFGTGIDIASGGELTWIGGSVVVGYGGRFIEIDGPGASIGAGNNNFTFIAPKIEMRMLGNSADGDPQVLYLSANAVVNFIGGTYETDEVSGSRTVDPIVIESKGRLNVENATNWDIGNFAITVIGANNDYASAIPAEVQFTNCQISGQLLEGVTLDDSGLSANFEASRPRASAMGCRGPDDRPVDVALNHEWGFRAYSPPVKRGVFRRGISVNGALPNATTPATFAVPRGCRVTKVGVFHEDWGSGSNTFTYVVRDGNGNTLHTTAAIGQQDDVVDESGPLFHNVPDDTTATFEISNVGADALQRGLVFVEWI